jgi:very-short-patch-repair endonuclease
MPPTHRPEATAERFARHFGDAPARYQEVLAAGITREQLRAAVQRGLIQTLRRGQYSVPPDRPDDGVDGDHPAMRARHVQAVRAALLSVGPGAFGTGESAALVLCLARPFSTPPERVELARPGIQDFAGPGLVVRGSAIPAHQVVVVDGVPVTDLRRTSLDLARGRALPRALIPLDAGMRAWIADRTGTGGSDLRHAVRDPDLRRQAREEWRYALRSLRGWPGVVAARRALEQADPASESPLESLSRGWLLRASIRCEIGVPLRSRGHEYWADFVDRDARLIGEADGWSKYGETVESLRERLRAEKARQADLESDGWRVLRWTSSDTEPDVVARWRAALRRD